MVAARLAALLPVGILTIPCYGDDHDAGEPGELANGTGDIVTVHARQPDIEHDGVGFEFARGGDGIRPIERHTHLVPF